MPDHSPDDLIELLARHKSQLFGYIVSIVHHVPDAEDVFQQTCVVVWEKFDRFEPGTDFVAWAVTIARNKSIEFLRKQQRERRGFSDMLLSQLAERQHDEGDLHAARARALETCSKKLPDDERKLIQQCYQRGVKIKDVAEDIGRPVGSVYDSLSRIRRKLFECIQRVLKAEGFE
ncbi:MAG: sigma-70 family RNA polymerase sigma factor [Pirellulales bacterium]|nr:sigma-70 family RNA polymerase sigma factor [Pirellulales bacterium]